jgi:hypothetical protein
MKPQSTEPNVKKWDSVHKCPQCGHILKLEDIDLKAATTGIVACPDCDLSGPIKIQVLERENPCLRGSLVAGDWRMLRPRCAANK